jgi:hypothetical protein
MRDTMETPSTTPQAPAADPALDALAIEQAMNRLAMDAHDASEMDEEHQRVDSDVRLIRDALADRITPAEARMIVDWRILLHYTKGLPNSDAERALIARLGQSAERDQ